jgi:SAM-dependent methyltransferase
MVHLFPGEVLSGHSIGKMPLMFHWLTWHLAKRRLAAVRLPPAHVSVWLGPATARPGALLPTTEPYSQLAGWWDEFAEWFVPQYAPFLAAAGRRYGVTIGSVLDLACGTGLASRDVARCGASVVGLDASAAMLRRAEALGGNVRYVHGDFRAFALGETFAAVLCCGDALNYVASCAELVDVFRCVRGHLGPGGLFAFDVLDGRHFRAVARLRTVAEVDGRRIELYHAYDPATRVDDARVVLGDSVEAHRRMAIDEEDVCRAAGAAGLLVTEHFSTTTYRLFPSVDARQFYVLRVPSG